MNNIWEVLLQGISVSITAGIILIIKKILMDKLSPRWQYGVWCVLILRILIPVNTISYILQPVPLWLETLKSYVEKNLSSAYTEIYKTISPRIPFPCVTGIPKSITDIIFVVYFAGVVIMLISYIINYIRIRMILKNAEEAGSIMKERTKNVCEKYSLTSCNLLEVTGIDTAFVTGIFSPVLVLPKGKDTDEKIILHELLHLKYHDVLHNMFWGVMKSLNWYNPFMWYVFNIVGNDMESLCDQRVLERLEGEERRMYGGILLEMANEKYARSSVTSSISNGGKNIKSRIESIVRFKKYPKGMAVVSVCIVFVLAFSLIGGYVKVYSLSDYSPHYEQIDKAMAIARINRPFTVAGAIDTYAKAVLNNNAVMFASVRPISEHEDIEKAISENPPHERYFYDPGRELAFINPSEGYRIFNLKRIDEDNYEAVLLFHTNGLYKEGSDEMLTSEDGEVYSYCGVSVKIHIFKEDGWCVKEIGERRTETHFLNLYQPPFDLIDATVDMSADSVYGTVRIRNFIQYEILNTVQNNNTFWNTTYFDKTPKTGATFSSAYQHFYCEYDTNTRTVSDSPKETYGIQIISIDSSDEKVDWPDTPMNSPVSGTSSDGFNWNVDRVREWDEDAHESVKENFGKSLSGSGGNVPFDKITGETEPSGIYKVRIFWDGKPVDEFVVMETDK